MAKISIFGASIVQGNDDTQGGWVQRLSNFLEKRVVSVKKISDRPWDAVFNLGISGDTSLDVLKRIYSETKVRRSDTEETVVMVSIGINDSAIWGKQKNNRVPEKTYRENLRKIVSN